MSRGRRALLVSTGALAIAVLVVQPSSASPASDNLIAQAQYNRAICEAALRGNLSSNDRTEARECIRIQTEAIRVLTLENPPLPTPTPTPTPSPTPTVGPTPSPTPSPTPEPTPTPTSTNNCMPVPSACGYPDQTNTGPTGPLTVVNGNIVLSVPGSVYENRDVRGCISVRAKNIIIRNVIVTCDGFYGIAINSGTGSDVWQDPNANLVIEDFEINMGGMLDGKAIAFDGYTARRGYIHNGSDCAHFGTNVTVADIYCVVGPDGGSRTFCNGPEHFDGFQSDGGNFITINHNTIRNPCGQTSAVLISTNTSPIGNVTITNNLAAGGGYTFYCATGAGPTFGNEVFMNNRISRMFYPTGGFWGPTTSCDYPNIQSSGNVWDDTGQPIPN